MLSVIVLLVNASVPASVATVPVVGSVTLVAPVEVRVIEFAPDVTRVDPLASVSVPVVVEIVSPLSVVAVAAPNTGVTSVGEVARTKLLEPVVATRVTADVPLPTKTDPDVRVTEPVPPFATDTGTVGKVEVKFANVILDDVPVAAWDKLLISTIGSISPEAGVVNSVSELTFCELIS